ncbi:hypothetical protein ONZ51_g7553 [Trametes cubensis]|uniref:Uncharacterized protein n=1 Tax=Trametes cubensis TaxID=1111947 RepID=A0AAD7X912_9APHY|nr:hypothetical protein ONZ51_g7553 [Trametes cubensis]
MYDLPAPPAPQLLDLEPHFFSYQDRQQIPELFGPFPLPVRSTYPFASLFNTYGGIMRLVPPSTLGPLELPRLGVQHSYDCPIALYIDFPTSMPTRSTPWILDPVHTLPGSDRRISSGATTIIPLLGKGTVVDIIDITTTTATLVLQPLRCPDHRIYVRTSIMKVDLPKPSLNIQYPSLSEHTGRAWPHKLRRAISAQL